MLQKAGINFNLLKSDGIHSKDLALALESSGLLRNDKLNWITFHGTYDLAYLYKVIKGTTLPETEGDFFDEIRNLFPSQWDTKVAAQ